MEYFFLKKKKKLILVAIKYKNNVVPWFCLLNFILIHILFYIANWGI